MDRIGISNGALVALAVGLVLAVGVGREAGMSRTWAGVSFAIVALSLLGIVVPYEFAAPSPRWWPASCLPVWALLLARRSGDL